MRCVYVYTTKRCVQVINGVLALDYGIDFAMQTFLNIILVSYT